MDIRTEPHHLQDCGAELRWPNWVTFTFWGDLLPGMRRVHEGSVLDLVVDVLVFIEGERSAETVDTQI